MPEGIRTPYNLFAPSILLFEQKIVKNLNCSQIGMARVSNLVEG
jgi:hypothetical protein